VDACLMNKEDVNKAITQHALLHPLPASQVASKVPACFGRVGEGGGLVMKKMQGTNVVGVSKE